MPEDDRYAKPMMHTTPCVGQELSKLHTIGGVEMESPTCSQCDAEEVPVDGVLVDDFGFAPRDLCIECAAEYLEERTLLSRREAEVAALKQLGMTHEEIAENLQDLNGGDSPTKATVDNYSGRINEKIQKAHDMETRAERTLRLIGGMRDVT